MAAMCPTRVLRSRHLDSGTRPEADGRFRQLSGALVTEGSIRWARLVNRVVDIDMQHFPKCGNAELKIIAAILERPVIEKILTHLALDPKPLPRALVGEPGWDQ